MRLKISANNRKLGELPLSRSFFQLQSAIFNQLSICQSAGPIISLYFFKRSQFTIDVQVWEKEDKKQQ